MYLIIAASVVIVGALVAFLIVTENKWARQKREIQEKKAAQEKAAARAAAEQLHVLQRRFDREYQQLTEQYGNCAQRICIGGSDYELKNYLFVFEESGTLYLRGEAIPFSKILGYQLTDDQKVEMEDNVSYITEGFASGTSIGYNQDDGFGVARSLGAINAVTRPVGSRTSTVEHDYRLYINIDDLSSPTRIIPLYEEKNKAYQISHLLEIIVHRNRSGYSHSIVAGGLEEIS